QWLALTGLLGAADDPDVSLVAEMNGESFERPASTEPPLVHVVHEPNIRLRSSPTECFRLRTSGAIVTMAAAMVRNPLSLYVHIPFCTLKCSYCDFNSYAGIESLMRPFVDALCDEMLLWAPFLADRRVETVFFGGGTPSLLPIGEVNEVMSTMRGEFALAA